MGPPRDSLSKSHIAASVDHVRSSSSLNLKSLLLGSPSRYQRQTLRPSKYLQKEYIRPSKNQGGPSKVEGGNNLPFAFSFDAGLFGAPGSSGAFEQGGVCRSEPKAGRILVGGHETKLLSNFEAEMGCSLGPNEAYLTSKCPFLTEVFLMKGLSSLEAGDFHQNTAGTLLDGRFGRGQHPSNRKKSLRKFIFVFEDACSNMIFSEFSHQLSNSCSKPVVSI